MRGFYQILSTGDLLSFLNGFEKFEIFIFWTKGFMVLKNFIDFGGFMLRYFWFGHQFRNKWWNAQKIKNYKRMLCETTENWL